MRRLLRYPEEALCALIFLAMTLLGFANICVRYLTNRSLASTEELLINGFVLLTVLGAAIAARRGDHLAVTLAQTLLPRRGRLLLLLLTTVLGLGLLLAAAWFTWELVAYQLASRSVTYALQVPAWWYSISLPFAFLLVALRFLQNAVAALRACGRGGGEA